jgi:hypothetical protein
VIAEIICDDEEREREKTDNDDGMTKSKEKKGGTKEKNIYK